MRLHVIFLLAFLLPLSLLSQAVFTRKLLMSGDPSITDVAAAANGNLYLSYEYGQAWGIAMLAPDGQIQWAREYNFPIGNLVISPTQALYATVGTSLIKLDLAGNILWAKNYPFSISSISIGPDGDIFTLTTLAARMDSNGTVIWTRGFPNLQMRTIAARQGGGALVIGNAFTASNIYNRGNLICLDDAGNVLWQREADNANLNFRNVAETVDRQVVVVASDFSSNYFVPVDFIRFDSAGTRLWHGFMGIQNGWMSDYATDVVATPDSGVAVIGSSSSGPNFFQSENFIYHIGKTGNLGGAVENLTRNFYRPNGAGGGSITTAPDGTLFYAHNWRIAYTPRKSWYGKVKKNLPYCYGYEMSGVGTRTSTFHAGTVTPTQGSAVATPTNYIVTPDQILDSLLCRQCFLSPTAAFAAAVTGSTATFTNTSANGNVYSWDFGDGSTSSQAQPVHTYAQGGTYTVCLSVTNACSTATTCQQVVVACSTANTPYHLPSLLQDTMLCGPATISVAAAPGFQLHSWSNGATTPTTTLAAPGTVSLVAQSTASGCYYTDTLVASIFNLANAMPAVTQVCPGATATLTPGAGLGTYAWSTGSTAAAITTATPGTYTVTVTHPAGCSSIASTQLSNFPAPAPTITPPGPTTICNGQSVSLSASGGYTQYLWNTGATTQSLLAAAAGTFAVTVTDANGCSGTTSTQVNALFYPSVSIAGSSVICGTGSVTLTATSGMSAYAWSTGATTNAITVSAPGTYTVSVTGTNGCTASTFKNVTQSPLPTPTINPPGPVTQCSGTNLQLTVSPAYNTYSWSTGSTQPSIFVFNPATYTLTVTDAVGCAGTASFTLSTIPSPSVTITSSSGSLICPGETTVLAATPGYASYAWNTGATTSSINVNTAGGYNVTVTGTNGCTTVRAYSITMAAQPVVNITPSGPTTFCGGGSVNLVASAGFQTYAWSNGATTASITATASGNYIVTATNSNGCMAVDTQAVTVITPTPTITPSGPTVLCTAGSVTLTAASGFLSYSWSNGATAQAITVSASGNYTVSVTDGNGCTGTATQAVSINLAPTPTITPSGPTTFCAGGSVTLSAPSGYVNYAWSNGGSGASTTATASGTYTVTVTDANGCTGTAAQAVTVNPAPTPILTPSGPTTFCVGGNVTLSASPGYVNYAWSNGGSGQNITVSTGATYTVTVTDASGCTGTAAQAVAVNPAPSPTITPSGPTTFCAGGNVTLSAPSGYVNYAWSNGASTQNITVSTGAAYTVTVTNANGCTGTATQQVSVLPTPPVSINANGPTSFCAGGSVSLTAVAGFGSFQWSTGATSATIAATASGTYTVTFTATNGCQNSASIAVNVLPAPGLSISSNSGGYICFGVATTLTASSGLTSYVWNTGSTSSAITTTTAGTYTVTATGSNGCTATATRAVTAINTCQTPTGLQATYITTAGALLVWNAVPCAVSYEVQWRKVGTGNWATASTSVNQYKVVPLLGTSQYQWRVRARCNAFGGWTPWSAIQTFTTLFAKAEDIAVEENGISLFPNPNAGKFKLRFIASDDGKAQLRIVDMMGRTVQEDWMDVVSGENEWSIQMPAVACGIYELWLTQAEGVAPSRIRFIVQERMR